MRVPSLACLLRWLPGVLPRPRPDHMGESPGQPEVRNRPDDSNYRNCFHNFIHRGSDPLVTVIRQAYDRLHDCNARSGGVGG